MNRNTKIQMVFFSIIAGLLALSIRTPAGLLNPSSPPGPTMRTLNEIFNQTAMNQAGLPAPIIPRSTRIFLQVPGIPGESTDPQHSGWIDVAAYQWGSARPSRIFPVAGGGSLTLGDLSVVKPVDLSTPKLFLDCCQGTHIPVMTLEVWNTAASPFAFFKIILNDAMITSVKPVGGASSNDYMMEEVSFDYSKIEVDYIPMDATGNPGIPVQARWDQSTGFAG
jgi:type VI secretion system secreted protein Hcp